MEILELENLFQKLNADDGPAKTDIARSTSDDEVREKSLSLNIKEKIQTLLRLFIFLLNFQTTSMYACSVIYVKIIFGLNFMWISFCIRRVHCIPHGFNF